MLYLDEDQCPLLRIPGRILHQLLQLLPLVELRHLMEALLHVTAGATHQAHRQEEIVVQELLKISMEAAQLNANSYLDPFSGMLGAVTHLWMSGMKPMSSILSASSSTRYLRSEKAILPLSA